MRRPPGSETSIPPTVGDTDAPDSAGPLPERTAKLTSELAVGLAERGWSTVEQFVRIIHDFIDCGIAEGFRSK